MAEQFVSCFKWTLLGKLGLSKSLIAIKLLANKVKPGMSFEKFVMQDYDDHLKMALMTSLIRVTYKALMRIFSKLDKRVSSVLAGFIAGLWLRLDPS